MANKHTRTCVVTGSASGIGAAIRRRLEAQGDRVIGVDLRDAEIVADLSDPAERSSLVHEVRAANGGSVDAVVACAGVYGATISKDLIVRVNYFGAVATLDGLQPMLASGRQPRAAAIISQAMVGEFDGAILEACLAGDEDAAVEAVADESVTPVHSRSAYGSSKRALARWIRREAPTPRWAGAGIPLNGISPGVVKTPPMIERLATEEGRATVTKAVPMPLHGPADPEHIADLVAWLVDPENVIVTGQVIFADGGSECMIRGDDVW